MTIRAENDKSGQKAQQAGGMLTALRPLAVEVGIPLGSYYLLRNAFGLGLVPSLALSSVVPAVSAIVTAVRDRKFNGLAGLMVLVNVVGIVGSLVSGDARLMFAKDGAISSVIGISILISVFSGRPLMSAGLKPMMTKGDAAKDAAWDRLVRNSARFQRKEKIFSAIWGATLLGECVARVILAYTLPISTMVWLSGVLVGGAIGLAIIIAAPTSGAIDDLVKSEVERDLKAEAGQLDIAAVAA